MTARALMALVCACLTTACATPRPAPPPAVTERVVLLPSATDRPSAVVVRTGSGEVLLDSPYSAADLRGHSLSASETSAERVQSRYGALLSAQPQAPKHFTVYFVLGTDDLTAESKAAFEEVRETVASWAAAEVVVIGHTDRVGSEQANDALSLQRAQRIAKALEVAGVSGDALQFAGRGEREPLIATADEVAEPRNRRVEIKVR